MRVQPITEETDRFLTTRKKASLLIAEGRLNEAAALLAGIQRVLRFTEKPFIETQQTGGSHDDRSKYYE